MPLTSVSIVVNPVNSLVQQNMEKYGRDVIAILTKNFSSDLKFLKTLKLTNFESIEHLRVYLRKRYFVEICLAGDESGVELAEDLSSLARFRNSPAKRDNRLNVYLQHLALKKAHLRFAFQELCVTPQEVEKFLGEEKLTGPYYIKTADRGSVFKCESIAAAKEQAKEVLKLHPHVVCMEYLNGEEYLVDTVVHESEMCIQQIYRSHHENDVRIYEETVPCEMDPFSTTQQIAEYCRRIQQALEVTSGPLRIRLRMTEKGPCLIRISTSLPDERRSRASILSKNNYYFLLCDSIFNSGEIVRQKIEDFWNGKRVFYENSLETRIMILPKQKIENLRIIAKAHDGIVSVNGNEVTVFFQSSKFFYFLRICQQGLAFESPQSSYVSSLDGDANPGVQLIPPVISFPVLT